MSLLWVHTVRADLDGDGSMTDITDWVDWDTGITYQWGRSDWSSSAPRPGLVRLRLDNIDGRFTPGSSTYRAGVRMGMRVEWGLRIRTRFLTVVDVTPRFMSDSSSSAVVELELADALGMLSRRRMRSMLDEMYLLGSPLAYWRLDESGTGDVHCRDTSGRGARAIVAVGSTDGIGWATGGGPPTDQGGAVYLGSGVETPSVTGPSLATEAAIINPRPADGAKLQFFFTAPLARSLPDGTAMHIATMMMGSDPVVLVARPDGGLVVLGPNGGYSYAGTLSDPASTHFAYLAALTYPFQPDKTYVESGFDTSGGSGNYVAAFGRGGDLRVLFGAPPPQSTALILSEFPSISTVCAHTGALSRVGLYSGDGLPEASWVSAPQDFYECGRFGSREAADDRAKRILRYAYPVITYVDGTVRGDIVGAQSSRGKSALDVLSEALVQDGGSVHPLSDQVEEVLTLHAYSVQRATEPMATFDVDTDCVGAPNIGFDRSAIAQSVTVESESTSAIWSAADMSAYDLSTSVNSAQVTYQDALSLAQYRASRGRITRPFPASITVSMTELYEYGDVPVWQLWPGARVRTTGWDPSVMGYDTVDGYVSGADETYNTSGSRAVLHLEPTDLTSPLWQIYDGATVSDAGRLQASAGNVLTAACSASASTVQVAVPAGSAFTTSQLPFTIQIGTEHLRVTGVAGGTLTVARGVDGTTAAAHAVGDPVTVVGVGFLSY